MSRYSGRYRYQSLTCPVIVERVANAGVACDGVLFKAGTVKPTAGLFYTSYATTGLVLSTVDVIAFSCTGSNKWTIGTSASSIDSSIATTTLLSTQDTASTDNGALITAGGIGIGGNLNIGQALSVAGSITATSGWLAGNGTAASPVYSFSGRSSTGVYQTGVSNNIGFTVSSSQRMLFSASLANFASTIQFNVGSTNAASITVTGGLGVAKSVFVGGTLSLTSLSAASFTAGVGSVSAPGYAVSGGLNWGMYYNATNASVCMSAAGTKVAEFTQTKVTLGEYPAVNEALTNGVAIGTHNGLNGVLGNGVCIGYQASVDDTGVAIGSYAQCTYGYCTVLGYQVSNGAAYQTIVGHNLINNAPHSILVGEASGSTYSLNSSYAGTFYCHTDWANLYCFLGGTTWYSSSDERLKTNIADFSLGMDLLRGIRPITFKFKPPTDPKPDQYIDHNTHYGFSYQRIMKALNGLGIKEFDAVQKLETDAYGSVAPTGLLPSIVNALKELEIMLDADAAELTRQGW